MSAMENMVRTILGALNIDVEAMKTEVVSRVTQFEKNVEALNSTLIALHRNAQRNEAKLDAIITHLRIPYSTANEGDHEQRKLGAPNSNADGASARGN